MFLNIMKYIITFSFLTNVFPINLTTDNLLNISNEELTELIERTIYYYQDESVEVGSLKILYDINNQPNYVLAEFREMGYAIFTLTNYAMSECNLDALSPYSNASKDFLFYYGPSNYYESNSISFVGNNNTMLNSNVDIAGIEDANSLMLSVTNPILSYYDIDSPEDLPINADDLQVEWDGVSSSTMQAYNWGQPSVLANYTSNGICGTVASSILLAYYDDYVENLIVPDPVRLQFSTNSQFLIETMWYNIDFLHPNGTVATDLTSGINNFFNIYQQAFGYHYYSAYYSLLISGAQNFLVNNEPVVLGLLTAYGSLYGNHWVTAYACNKADANANLPAAAYYKCVDTWAEIPTSGQQTPGSAIYPSYVGNNYRALIYQSWVSCYVYLDN